jgi:Holliday junction DNA helicase RuvA
LIEFVYGKVDSVQPEYIVVESNDIGYLIYSANPLSFQKYKDTYIKIFTYHYVREDMISLFGFETREERTLFTNLLSVSGIGPKGALAILAAGEPGHVVSAIENEDEKYLTNFPGVGKKTARQMILDLKGKLEHLGGKSISLPDEAGERPSKALDEAAEALKSLGYAEREINKVIAKISHEQLSADQYVKKALAYMLKH